MAVCSSFRSPTQEVASDMKFTDTGHGLLLHWLILQIVRAGHLLGSFRHIKWLIPNHWIKWHQTSVAAMQLKKIFGCSLKATLSFHCEYCLIPTTSVARLWIHQFANFGKNCSCKSNPGSFDRTWCPLECDLIPYEVVNLGRNCSCKSDSVSFYYY